MRGLFSRQVPPLLLFFFLPWKIHHRLVHPYQWPAKKQSTKRLKTLTTASLVLFITQRLFWQGGRSMWEHFKDQTFCHALRRRPDSLLLSAMRGPPPRMAGVHRDTDGHCLVFSFSSVRRHACLRAQTCSPRSEGYAKSMGPLVWFGSRMGGGK